MILRAAGCACHSAMDTELCPRTDKPPHARGHRAARQGTHITACGRVAPGRRTPTADHNHRCAPHPASPGHNPAHRVRRPPPPADIGRRAVWHEAKLAIVPRVRTAPMHAHGNQLRALPHRTQPRQTRWDSAAPPAPHTHTHSDGGAARAQLRARESLPVAPLSLDLRTCAPGRFEVIEGERGPCGLCTTCARSRARRHTQA